MAAMTTRRLSQAVLFFPTQLGCAYNWSWGCNSQPIELVCLKTEHSSSGASRGRGLATLSMYPKNMLTLLLLVLPWLCCIFSTLFPSEVHKYVPQPENYFPAWSTALTIGGCILDMVYEMDWRMKRKQLLCCNELPTVSLGVRLKHNFLIGENKSLLIVYPQQATEPVISHSI